MFKTFSVAFLATLIAIASIAGSASFLSERAEAQSGPFVYIDDVVLSRCGAQEIHFTGVAWHPADSELLLVDLDGTPVFRSEQKSPVWTTGLIPVSAGNHVLTARIHTSNPANSVDFARNVIVVPCEGDKDEGDRYKGKEGDCCPGADASTSKVKKPKVKAAVAGINISDWQRLEPINSLFRLVFGRTPTFLEWEYWATRILGDKPEVDAIYGAMEWQRLQGRSVGN